MRGTAALLQSIDIELCQLVPESIRVGGHLLVATVIINEFDHTVHKVIVPVER